MIKQFVEETKANGYLVEHDSEFEQLFITLPCCSKWRIILNKQGSFYLPTIYYQTSYELQDAALVIPIFQAAYEKFEAGVTFRLISINNGIYDDNLDGMLFFPSQPLNEKIRIDNFDDFKIFGGILTGIYDVHNGEMDIFFHECDGSLMGEENLESWEEQIIKSLNLDPDIDYYSNYRPESNWYFFREYKAGTAVIKSVRLATIFRNFSSLISEKCEYVKGKKSKIEILNKNIRTVLSKKIKRLANKFFNDIEPDTNSISFITQENFVVAIGKCHILTIEANCGRSAYNKELELILKRQNFENKLLFSDKRLKWNIRTTKDSAEFEDLIVELLEREPWIYSPKKVAPTNQGDNGRDIICSFDKNYSSHLLTEKSNKAGEMIVQCKTKLSGKNRKPIGRNAVSLHCIQDYNPDAYLLVVNSEITRDLTEGLERLRKRYTDTKIDWWLARDVEDRLRNNNDILQRYKHIVDYE